MIFVHYVAEKSFRTGLDLKEFAELPVTWLAHWTDSITQNKQRNMTELNIRLIWNSAIAIRTNFNMY